MSSYTFIDLAADTIKVAEKPLSISEMWDKAKELNFVQRLGSSGKTPEKTLGARLYMDIKVKSSDSVFVQVSKRPAKFYLKSLPQSNDHDIKEIAVKVPYKERDLHILLSSFLFSDAHFNCYTKTIFHEKSNRKIKGQNSWLHPDIVGVRYPFDDYGTETRLLMKAFEFNKCRLFSFELKISIDFSNLRECFFQVVSNSSWAHEGYLVATKFDKNPDFFDELLRLNNAFGIGFIRLDTNDYLQSEIILNSKSNLDLDWNTIDRLCQDNNDFKKFISSVRKELIQSEIITNPSEIYKTTEEYDRVFTNEDDFRKYLADKKII